MVVTFTGDNDSAWSRALAQFVANFRAEQGDMAIERLDGAESSFEALSEAVQTVPFLSTSKLVVIRTPGSNKDIVEKLDYFLSGIAETNQVVFLEPKLDKRTSYAKQLRKKTDFREYSVLDGYALVAHVSAYVKEQGGSISRSDAQFLIDRVGANQMIVEHELDKLVAFKPAIDREAIEILTDALPQSRIFELLDTAFAGNISQAILLYEDQRAQRIEPQYILAMLAKQLYLLAIVKVAGERNVEKIARDMKQKTYPVQKAMALAGMISYQRCLELIDALLDIDIRSKSTGINLDDALRLYLFELART